MTVAASDPITVAVVGAGAIGCALLPRLARMRIHELRVIDGDRVEERNLERQPLYAEVDIGHFKASTARGWLGMAGPGIEVLAIDRFLDPGNAAMLLGGATLVADCTDDLHAKDLIDRTCGELGLPLVSGAVHERQGQVITLHGSGEGSRIQRQDLFRGRTGPEQDGCDMRGVPEEVIEAVGRRMAGIIHAFLKGTLLHNGRIEMFHHGTWTAFETPR